MLLFLLESGQQLRDKGAGTRGRAVHLLMLLVRSSEERPQHLLHRFTEIEIHADVALGLGQREQTSRDGLDLLLLPFRVQGDDLQRQELDGIEEISWPDRKSVV